MHRNKHLIVSSKGQKYELNQANWTTYQNFSQMYEVIEQEMITAGVAVMLPEPVWMNAKGEHVEEGDAFGCKVTLDITKPEMCVVADEVGGVESRNNEHSIAAEQCTSTENNSTRVLNLDTGAVGQGHRREHVSYADALRSTDNLGEISMNVGPTLDG